MDILEMLQNDYEDLCPEDLEMIEEELAVGDFSYDYIAQCQLLILNITNHFREKELQKGYIGNRTISPMMKKSLQEVTVVVNETETESGEKAVVGETQAEQKEKNMTKAEILHERLERMRSMPEPEKNFREYMQSEEFLTNEFIDHNFSEFDGIEKIILLQSRTFDEAFLDKYFDVLDHKELALHQLYSEEFFMKHFQDMSTRIVLQKSKNSWRKKDQRSSKLSTFLRLKGVRI